ncbi:MAG: FG-GAP-like repeat-containing protein, partial [Bacteroidota bacterium]
MKHSILRSSFALLLLVLITASAWAAAPTISSTSPAINSLNVTTTSNITVTFDQSMNNATLIASNIKVHGNYRGFYSAAFSVSGNTVTINPDSSFLSGEVITVSVTTGVQNAGNEPMAAPYVTRFTAVAGEATSAFQAKVDYATPNTPNQVTAADLDNDGDVDLVTAHPGGDKMAVLMNNGNATFAAYVQYTTGGYPNAVAAGDFNGDGDVDLVTANAFDNLTSGNSISIFSNNGSGTFAAKVDYIAGTAPYGVVAVDVDGDGDIDVVTANTTGDSISVFLNTGSGTFAAKADYACGNDPRSITAGDIDGDGDIDVIVGRYTDNKISVVFNNGSGAFTSYNEYAAYSYVNCVTAADVNNDGALDVIAASYDGITTKESVFLNKDLGDGDLNTKVDYTVNNTGGGGKSVATGDVDGDGDLDMIVTSATTQMSVLLNNGSGTFGSQTDYTTLSNPTSVIAADLNGNGVVDIALTSSVFPGPSVSIFKNVPVVEISSTSPTANALTVSPSANITVTFTALMNSATMTSSTVKVFGSITGPKAGAYSYDAGTKTMTFDPTTDFARGENVTVVVTTEVQAIDGSAISPSKNFSFTIASAGTGEGHFSINVSGGFFSKNEHDFLSADVDNDGDADLIGYYYNTGFSVSKNNSGVFDAPVNYNSIPENAGWGYLHYADMDNDGIGDIVLLQYNSSAYKKVVILKNNGSGVFSRYDSVALSSEWTYSLEVKDFNNDGKPDVAYKHGGTSAYVSFNTPGWSSTSTLTIPSTQSLTSADVDNDGDVDLIFYGNGSSVYLMKNNGDGTFASATTITANNYQDVYFRDVNGDGYVDLLASVGGPLEFATLFNNGDGTFASPTTYGLSIQPVKFTFGDYNADGSVDIAFSYQNESLVNIAYNNGSGSFSQQLVFPQLAADLTAMDYDNDGDIDLLGSNNANGRVILTNIPVSAPTTDASSVTFSSNYGSVMKVSWTNGNGSRRLVVMKEGSAVDGTPASNTSYTANTVFTSGNQIGTGNYVVYNGVGSEVTISGLTTSTEYHVSIFEYNGLNGEQLYATPGAGGTGSQTTSAMNGYPFDTTAGYAFRYNNNGYSTSSSAFAIPDGFTYEVWTTPASIGSQMVILDHGDDYVWIAIDATGKFFGRVYDDNASNNVDITGTTTAVADQWYHLVLTGASGSPLKLYVNGVLEATSGGNIGALVTGNQWLYPGTDNYSNYYYSGDIDELRIWNDIRTESEIRENMYKTLSGFPANLLHYWQFNEGTGSTVAELVNEIAMDQGDATWVASGAPVGGAIITNTSVAASNNGPHTIGNATLSMTDGFDNPVDVYVSELTAEPSNYPTGYGSSVGSKYFVINLFGNPGTFSTSLTLNFGAGVLTTDQHNNPSTIKLFKRESNSTGTWTDLGGAVSADSTTGTVTWAGITSFSQFMAAGEGNVAPPTLTFTKANYADWTLEANQDRITDNVWLTRKDNEGLFNIKTQAGYNSSAPAGTEWAAGTTENIGSLTFDTWNNTTYDNWGDKPNMVGHDMVVHLIADDVYLDIKFLSWTSNDNGGGFSYTRSLVPLLPSASAATNITTTTATLNGSVWSTDVSATAYFLIGTSSGTYTDSVASTPATINADSTTAVTTNLTSLTPETTYYVRIAATNASLYKQSGEISFTTGALLADTASAATNVGATYATLNGNVRSVGLSATAYFLIGTSSGTYTDSVASTPASINADSTTAISTNLSSLTAGTTYYVRVAATNASIYKRSSEITFTTNPTEGYSLLFDGTDDYISVATGASTLSAPYTIEVWVKPNTTSGTLCFFDTRGPGEFGFDVKLQNGTTIHADIGSGSGWLTTSADATLNYSAGTWYHIAYAVTTSGYTIYANGNQVGSGSFGGTPLLFDANHNTIIGSQGGGGEFFNGFISNVRVWDVARTQAEIQNNKSVSFTGPQTNLVANWLLNDGSGTTANDTAASFNGALNNFNFNASSGWQAPEAPLPVELISFTATSKRLNAELKWKTATELNNYGYEIERTVVSVQKSQGKDAAPTKNWSKVGFLEGSGTSNAPKEYTFTDKVQKAGKYSYRLKQIDRDGKFSYSQAVEVNVGA